MTEPVRTLGPDDFPAEGPNSIAGLGARLLARLLDGLLLAVPLMAVFLSSVELDANTGEPPEIPYGVSIATLVILGVYDIVLVAWRGQTLGKMALNIRVASLGDGGTPSVTSASIRAMLPVVLGFIPILGWVLQLGVYIAAAFDGLRRGWHDRAAGTVVVRTR